MAVAAWAGLSAWQDSTPTWAGERVEVAVPELVEVELAPFPREPARTVEASADLRSGARPPTGSIVARLSGIRAPIGPNRIALLDGATGAALVDRPLPGELPAELAFDQVPVGDHWLITYRDGDSPRRRYATRARATLEETPGAPRVEIALDVTTTRAVVLLELLEVPSERTWVPVTAVLTRPGDAQWAASPDSGARTSFEPGSADVLLEFGELGPGRYELRAIGFEPLTPIVFDLPASSVVFAVGKPR